jgi:GST-like protein
LVASPPYHLITAKGGGGLIVEAALALAGVPYEVEDLAWEDVGPQSQRLAGLNPLGQVPTCLLPDGSVMTESAALVLHLSEVAPHAGLSPPPGDPLRPAFLRWLAFYVAAVYPTFTYGDDPARWVGEAPGPALRASTDAHRERLLRFLDTEAAREPWFLGERFSALDLYVLVMRPWRPGPKWLAANAPRLDAIAARCETLPAVARVLARNQT